MGLWDWILSTIIGDEAGPGKNRDSGGVAVLEDDAPRDESPDQATESSTSSLESSPDESEGPANATDDANDCWWKPAGVDQTEYTPGIDMEPVAEIRMIEGVLISHFDGHDLAMPPFPQVAERVLKQLRDRHCSMSQVASLIAEDQVTTANVLRMANSPLYRGVDKITSLQQAVTRLGANAVRTLMMHHSLKAAVFGKRSANEQLVDLVWGGSLASATVMRTLAKFTKIDPEDAFLIGLMHDIGNVIVLRTVTEEERRFHMTVDVRSFEYLCHVSHQEFGELIADAWKLPERVKALICDHHSHPEPDDPLRTERLMLIVTDMINQMLGYGPEAQYDLLSTRAVQELGLLDAPGFGQCLAELPLEIEEIAKSLT